MLFRSKNVLTKKNVLTLKVCCQVVVLTSVLLQTHTHTLSHKHTHTKALRVYTVPAPKRNSRNVFLFLCFSQSSPPPHPPLVLLLSSFPHPSLSPFSSSSFPLLIHNQFFLISCYKKIKAPQQGRKREERNKNQHNT